MSDKLLDHLIKIQNKSGAIKPAPHGLKKLKESLMGVPFKLEVPGMSGVVNAANLSKGIQSLMGQLGSLQAVGNFGNMLGGASGADMQSRLQSLGVGQLIQAVGGATALTASLSNYLGAADSQSIQDLAPKT